MTIWGVLSFADELNIRDRARQRRLVEVVDVDDGGHGDDHSKYEGVGVITLVMNMFYM